MILPISTTGNRVFLCISLFLLSSTLSAQRIQSFTFTTGIEKLYPIDNRKIFQVGERAWAWIKVVDYPPGDTLLVEWYGGETLLYTQRLRIPYRSMRTYCYKNLRRPGIYSVIVRTPEDQVLLADSFLVKE
ncbi:MAG: hypothetical protein AAF696_07435 [Bacteroidota bacterium]